ncbi:hypothetical protein BGZ67_002925 [Mortierella alpina]|nr:hypothetical protein BGZ67_002925 [Mortierella alpina]
MYCNNCCLCLPIRGGGIWLSAVCILVSTLGAIIFFIYGSSLYFSPAISFSLGGISILHATASLIAFFGLGCWSYILLRIFVYTQWILTFVSVARIGVVAFVLQHNRDQIISRCQSGTGIQGTASVDGLLCRTPVDSVILSIVLILLVDWILNGYMYFVLWRFYVRMRDYPETIKGETFSDEEALDEL